uniref:SCP domain-containing protein n=1 Tax=Esox lucius TaxID=8010 RepID=A0AAY5K6N6_ESOLU
MGKPSFQFVDAHNDYRQKHGAPPLTLSKDLCNSAQKWADHLLKVHQEDITVMTYYGYLMWHYLTCKSMRFLCILFLNAPLI